MIDHMTFRVGDIARTRAFYGAVLGTLGYAEGYFGAHGDEQMLGYQLDGRFDTWFIQGPPPWGGPPPPAATCAGARPAVRRSTPSTPPHWPRAGATTAHPACARTTTRTTTARS
jgi:catechol 2,3-dioxygenase-like lactoylglutathione lyase family enzyme